MPLCLKPAKIQNLFLTSFQEIKKHVTSLYSLRFLIVRKANAAGHRNVQRTAECTKVAQLSWLEWSIRIFEWVKGVILISFKQPWNNVSDYWLWEYFYLIVLDLSELFSSRVIKVGSKNLIMTIISATSLWKEPFQLSKCSNYFNVSTLNIPRFH